MKLSYLCIAGAAALVLSACQMDMSQATADGGVVQEVVAPSCKQPNDRRDKFIARMLAQGNSPETIAEVRAGYESQGANPDEASSYAAFISLLTGAENPNGAQETADYKVCFERFKEG